MNLLDIRTDVFNRDAVIASIYKVNSKGIPFFDFKTTIKSFKEEMKQSNNIILICDNDYNITSGQIGTYSLENGLNTIMF